MTGRRARRLLREEMDRKYWRLGQFFGGYLHEDRAILHGTPEQAVDTAISEHPVELRQQVRQELRSLLAETEEDTKLKNALNDGLGVNLYFRHPREAREFAEEVERKLLASIEAHFEQQRRG